MVIYPAKKLSPDQEIMADVIEEALINSDGQQWDPSPERKFAQFFVVAMQAMERERSK